MVGWISFIVTTATHRLHYSCSSPRLCIESRCLLFSVHCCPLVPLLRNSASDFFVFVIHVLSAVWIHHKVWRWLYIILILMIEYNTALILFTAELVVILLLSTWITCRSIVKYSCIHVWCSAGLVLRLVLYSVWPWCQELSPSIE